MATATPVESPDISPEDLLQARVKELEAEVDILKLKIKDLNNQLWGKKSERYISADGKFPGDFPIELFDSQTVFSSSPLSLSSPLPTPSSNFSSKASAKGPRPLNPVLPREVIRVSDPDARELVCPVTKKPMQPGFTDTLEVLARRPAVYYVKRYERRVFVSPAKTAPVYSPWPTEVLSKARVHASVVAHIAAAHYGEHLPFYRIEQQLKRTGVNLPRNTQVSLMQQLDEMVKPLVERIQRDVLGSGYVHIDATPVDVLDPKRPGAAREATLWAYRANDGMVSFDFQTSKSPEHPRRVLAQAKYSGIVQTDGAAGLDQLGPPDQVTHLACWAHCRRYFFKASEAGDHIAQEYLDKISRLFHIDARAQRFALAPPQHTQFRARYSEPIIKALFEKAVSDAVRTPPKSGLGRALRYMLGQRASLERCVTTPGGRLDNNLVENAIRPVKLGAKNWLFIGHPNAGERMANLFTLVENCRLCGIDAETYLIDIISRLLDHPANRLGELLPRQWKEARSNVHYGNANVSGTATANVS